MMLEKQRNCNQQRKYSKSNSVFLHGCRFSPVFSGFLTTPMLQLNSQVTTLDPPKKKIDLMNNRCEQFNIITDINIRVWIQPLDNCWHRLEQRFWGRIRLLAQLWALWWHFIVSLFQSRNRHWQFQHCFCDRSFGEQYIEQVALQKHLCSTRPSQRVASALAVIHFLWRHLTHFRAPLDWHRRKQTKQVFQLLKTRFWFKKVVEVSCSQFLN